jgi:hypothetical protein
MSNDVTKKPIEGEEDRSPAGRVIQGTRIAFTNEATWVDSAGQELPADLELIVVDIARIVQKWTKDNQPIETIVLAPNQKYPDVRAMNEQCPKSEWREWNGQLQGPWQAQHVAYLLDPVTMNKYSWPTGTTGGNICIRELVDKTKMMRRFRGQHVYAVVKLSDTFMSTRWGGRQRPDLIIKRWVTLDGSGALPPSETPTLTGPGPADSTPSATEAIGMRTVTPPSAKEVTGDEILY